MSGRVPVLRRRIVQAGDARVARILAMMVVVVILRAVLGASAWITVGAGVQAELAMIGDVR